MDWWTFEKGLWKGRLVGQGLRAEGTNCRRAWETEEDQYDWAQSDWQKQLAKPALQDPVEARQCSSGISKLVSKGPHDLDLVATHHLPGEVTFSSQAVQKQAGHGLPTMWCRL